ncbi:MAG: hypothetical protein DRN83_01515 [Hadesarchaea archaeon]|nr:MAG: hypothetical protein DRN83_01515 [Hadesarchaea archaeon]
MVKLIYKNGRSRVGYAMPKSVEIEVRERNYRLTLSEDGGVESISLPDCLSFQITTKKFILRGAGKDRLSGGER